MKPDTGILERVRLPTTTKSNPAMPAISTSFLASITIAVVGVSLIFNTWSVPLVSSLGFAIVGGIVTFHMIPALGPAFIRVGLSGRDLSKKDKPLLPETMGAVSALVYLFCLCFFIPFMFYSYFVTATSGSGNREEGMEVVTISNGNGRTLAKFPHNKLAGYLSGLLSLQSMFILGVADDLFDIRWRNKFFLPAIAAIPLLIVYFVDFGVTYVTVPNFLRDQLGDVVDIGSLYYVYMAAVAIFCPNSINILAGVNGIEVGQSLVIGVSILINDFLYILRPYHPAADSHLLSAYLLIPFLGVTIPLLYHNWWPAQVFVGDTYCYIAGMVFAVTGILGHFSKTILLFFIPQIFNFLYSAPQLFKVVECPRHRMPKFNTETGLLEPSKVEFKVAPSPTLCKIFTALEKLKLLGVHRSEKGNIVAVSNLTLINLVLVNTGPMREDNLTKMLMCMQFGFCICALVARHSIATLIFAKDNL